MPHHPVTPHEGDPLGLICTVPPLVALQELCDPGQVMRGLWASIAR